MYAIIEAVGKQVKVSKGQKLKIDLLDKKENEKVTFENVLIINDGKDIKVGQPYVENAVVEGKVLGATKDKKVIVYKYKNKTGYHKKQGHRQNYLEVEITDIKTKKAAAKKEATKAEGSKKEEVKAEVKKATKPKAAKTEAKPKTTTKKAAPKTTAKKPTKKQGE
jgi:large subunit ribosomal protein L21